MRWIWCGVLALWPGLVFGQTTMRDDQVARVAWTVDCTNLCDQPMGTAGYRLLVDGVSVGTFPPASGTHDLGPLLGVGVHTVTIQAFNCAAVSPECPAEQAVNSVAVTLEVTAAPTPPPNQPAPPSITVLP